MDDKRFDNVARGLYADTPRRGMFGLLLGGALGLAGLTESAAKGKGKGKGKGGKGKGGKGKGKDKNICLKVAATCGASTCGEGDSCCSTFECDCRQNLVCNFTGSEVGICGCASGQEMHNGRCGTKPVCIPTGQKRGFYDVACCSGQEIIDLNGNPRNGECLPGTLLCLGNADCTGGQCRGYGCYAPELSCNMYYT